MNQTDRDPLGIVDYLKEVDMDGLKSRRQRVEADLAWLERQSGGRLGLLYSWSPRDGKGQRYVLRSGGGTLKGLRELEVWTQGAVAAEIAFAALRSEGVTK